MKGSIKHGATVFQDFSWSVISHKGDKPPLIMDIVKCGYSYKCTAPGYGEPGNYGSGALYVEHREDLIIFNETDN